jgi:hypothetical protein
MGPWHSSATGPVNLVADTNGMYRPIEVLLPQYATHSRVRRVDVTDYFRIIEANGCHPSSQTGNSDYTNTYDMHLSWAGIDPALIPSHNKRPFYHCTAEERAWADGVLKSVPRPVMLWQPYASAPARSYYRAGEDMEKVRKEVGGYHLLWDQQRSAWMHRTGAVDIGNIAPIRATAALIAASDLLISADTFVSHLAEALGVPHLTWYTTVSAWTRSLYYEHEYTHDLHPEGGNPVMPCKCHVITDARCPLVEMEAIAQIPDEDKAFLNTLPPQARGQLGLPAELFDVSPDATPRNNLHPTMVQAYAQTVAQKYNIARHAEPYCLRGFDLAEAVLDVARQIGRGK